MLDTTGKIAKSFNEFSPAVKYSDDKSKMTITAVLPQEAVENYKVDVDGTRVIVRYDHVEEHKSENSYSKQSYSRSFSHSTGKPIKTCDAHVGDNNVLKIDITFEDNAASGNDKKSATSPQKHNGGESAKGVK